LGGGFNYFSICDFHTLLGEMIQFDYTYFSDGFFHAPPSHQIENWFLDHLLRSQADVAWVHTCRQALRWDTSRAERESAFSKKSSTCT